MEKRVMYYPFVAQYLSSSRGDRDMILFKSLVNDYDCVEPFRNIKQIFGLNANKFRPFDNILFVLNGNTNLILGNDKYSFISDGRMFNMIRVDEYKLYYRFYKFLFRLIHDADKAFGSLDMCFKFLHDYAAGATPADLWNKYCWYRIFGNI